MPHSRWAWVDAMRSEFEHVKDRPDASAWLVGCVFASYSSRLADLWTRYAHQAIRRLAASGVVVIVVGYALENRACGQTPPPAFTDTACELPHVTPDIRPRLRCGVVAVPRNYAHPEAGQYKLAVVVIRSERQPAAPEPVVYMSGGPGGPLTVYTYYQAAHPLAAGRDIILVDQRGTGRSEPDLCPSLPDGFADTLVEAMLDPAAEEQRRALFAACRKEAMAQGIDLADFGTPVTAEDFDRVRQALGIERWNLFGVSYGTTVAMTLMARHPETVRSAILDSINPPDPILPPWSANVTDAVKAFLAFCQVDASCNAMYPDLAGTYRDTVDQLRKVPLSFPLPSGLHGFDSHGPLTAGLFELVVGRMVYFPQFYPRLPRLIAQVITGICRTSRPLRRLSLQKHGTGIPGRTCGRMRPLTAATDRVSTSRSDRKPTTSTAHHRYTVSATVGCSSGRRRWFRLLGWTAQRHLVPKLSCHTATKDRPDEV